MLEKAIEKIKKEMEKENNSYVNVVGEYLLDQLDNNPAAAEKILGNNKTLMGSLKEMEKEAKEHKIGNVGVITPDHGFAIVLEYFGIDAAGQEKKKVNFDVKLDDLL